MLFGAWETILSDNFDLSTMCFYTKWHTLLLSKPISHGNSAEERMRMRTAKLWLHAKKPAYCLLVNSPNPNIAKSTNTLGSIHNTLNDSTKLLQHTQKTRMIRKPQNSTIFRLELGIDSEFLAIFQNHSLTTP